MTWDYSDIGSAFTLEMEDEYFEDGESYTDIKRYALDKADGWSDALLSQLVRVLNGGLR